MFLVRLVNSASEFSEFYASTLREVNSGWTHCAFTWDGSTVKLFVNGVLDSTGSFGGPMKAIAGTEKNMTFGNYNSSVTAATRIAPGWSLDEFRVWSRTLSEPEIAMVYADGANIVGLTRSVGVYNGSTTNTLIFRGGKLRAVQ